jgi:hypothetical protein
MLRCRYLFLQAYGRIMGETMPGKMRSKLFSDNPPPGDQEVRELFLNREAELQWGLDLLRCQATV